MQTDVLTIDGSYGEGGGQVIRTSVALAAITRREIRVVNVRAGRAKPGLKAQHVVSVQAASRLVGAVMTGVNPGSMEFSFRPTCPVHPSTYRFDIGTAGSTVLVAQTVFVPLALADGDSEVTITGGTHNDFAPSADFFEQVFLQAMAKAGIETEYSILRYGFVPGGGGEIAVVIRGGRTPQGLDLLVRGEPKQTRARVIVSNHLPQSVGSRGAEEIRRLTDLGSQVDIVESRTPGAATHIACEFESGFAGFVGLGAKGKPIESAAAESGEGYRRFMKSTATVDEHLADQLVLPLAFAVTKSRWVTRQVTEHLRTVIWVVGQFLHRKISLEERADGTGLVTID